MHEHAAFFLNAAERFSATVEATTDWSAATPCEGWTAADLVDHVVDTERDFLALHGADLGARPAGDPAQRWREHLAGVRPLVSDDAFTTREYDGHLGRTTIGTSLQRFYGFDLVVHGWDLGVAGGRPPTLTAAELDVLEAAFEAFGDAAYAPGVFGPPLDVPADADRQTRLLARTGRRA